ncbi:hypothetical protein [Rappaport israeli]|uniref:hypothetical protein n=1 Tax=Rappaport israeli TaxID=1839807 RepID=UPI00117869A5|nr:hypothetical protein [Rappaport israeli]
MALTFAGYTLDSIAVAAETFTGQSIGKRSQNTLKQAIKKPPSPPSSYPPASASFISSSFPFISTT